MLKWSFAGQKKLPDDLEYITHYLFENAPGRTADLVREIYNAPSGLLKFPYRGRPAREVIHIGASYTVRRNGIKDSWLSSDVWTNDVTPQPGKPARGYDVLADD